MALAAKLDKTTYAPGEPMVLTVTTAPGERDRTIDTPMTIHVDVEGVGAADVSGVLKKPTTPAAVVVTDPDRTWTTTSDSGTSVVSTAKA